jgi:flagellar hook-associated protein 3 FlgL
MSILPIGLARVSTLLQASQAAQTIDSTQSQLQQVENELSTGKAVNEPSDNPEAASMIEQLNKTLTSQQTYNDNINSATSQLSETDSTLGDLTNLLEQATGIASANVGSDVSAQQRQSAAAVVQTIYNQALTIGNTQFNNTYLFSGSDGDTAPFVATSGGVQFVGSQTTLQNTIDEGASLSFQVNGASVFGSMATGVTGSNISPQLTPSTLLSNLGGATGQGVRLGAIQISDGTVTKTVNLSSASSVQDVVNLINNAGVGSITASITGQGLTLTGTSGENITVTDVAGTAASDLGIVTSPTGAGTGNADVGGNLSPKITPMTLISDLRGGLGIDSTGIIITNGQNTQKFTFPATSTVQDILNEINGSNLGVSAQINSTGTGINITNATQGTAMTIGENGGTTATELGIRSFTPSTPLSELNNGQGVQTAGGTTPDFTITRANGTNFQVSISGAQTVADVIKDINTADGGHGITAGFSTTGNGIVLTDTTGGSGEPSVTPLNDSPAAGQLGLLTTAKNGTLTGSDVNPLQGTGIFNDLQNLINGLNSNNQGAITAAGTGITNDTNNVIEIRGQTGAAEQELASRQTQLTQEGTATQTLIASLQDTDIATTVTQFQTLQTSLQASLEATAQTLNLSLMDFLD